MPSSLHRPRKRFGQHFLHDRRVLQKILDAIAPQAQDVIVEIGPGEGALTRLLLERSPLLEAIELDRDLAARLRQELPALKLHQADALSLDYAGFQRGVRLVGNLPYNISTPLLFHLARYAARLRDLHFMLQLEVVERMVAAPSTPAYGRLSVALQTRFRMRKLFNVSSGAFRPPPRVESAFVRLEPLAAADVPRELDDVLRQAFSARRKTLRNALAGVNFAALGLDAGLRPEDLSPQDFLRIAAQAKIAS